MTLPTVLVLRTLLEADRELYGLEITSEAGLPSGTIHPILARLEKAGWVTSRWEEIKAHEQGRPRRRYYRITAEGREGAQEALERRGGALRPRPWASGEQLGWSGS